MSNTITIRVPVRVTQDCIDRGLCKIAGSCAAAKGIQDALPEATVEVYPYKPTEPGKVKINSCPQS